MKKQTIYLSLLFVLNILAPIKLAAMENPENGKEENYSHFENLATEVQDCILRNGIATIIKQNTVFEPFKDVLDFVIKFSNINHSCRNLANLITMLHLKSIAKEVRVGKRFKNLTEESDEIWELLRKGCTVREVEKDAAELIIAGANPRQRLGRSIRMPILNQCAINGFDNLVKLLITYGASIDAVDYMGQDALFLAAMSGNLDMVKIFLACGANANTYNNLGRSALFVPIYMHYSEIVDELIKHGADVNNPNGSNILGETPLLAALNNTCDYEPDINIVKLLLQYDIDLDYKDRINRTALDYAKLDGYVEIQKLLEEHQENKKRQEKNNKWNYCLLS